MDGVSYIKPVEEALRSGVLHLSDSPGAADVQTFWAEIPLNSALLVLLALLMIANMRNFLTILPTLTDCLSRWKANVNMEANVHLSISRNYSALIAFLPFCLLAARFDLFPIGFVGAVPEGYRTLAVMGVVLCYALLRQLAFYSFSLRAPKPDMFRTIHFSSYNYFLIATLLLMVLDMVMLLARCPDETIRSVSIYATGAVYLLSLARKYQLFTSYCNPFQTFLYLCGLEFIPTGALIAAVVLL